MLLTNERGVLPDRSTGDRNKVNPLYTWSWQDLRGEI